MVTGFQGITEAGDVTTLGRGGSDTSAIAIASSLNCPCEIYSDVAGVFATDPRIEPSAKRLEYVTCEEMLELASLGAKVLHSRAVEIAQTHHVPLCCGSTFSDERGTFIVNQLPEWLEQPVVTGVAIDKDQTRVTLRDIPAGEGLYTHIFTELATAAHQFGHDRLDHHRPWHGVNDLYCCGRRTDDGSFCARQCVEKLQWLESLH